MSKSKPSPTRRDLEWLRRNYPDVDPHDVEWLIPSDAADFLSGPRRVTFRKPLTLSDGRVIDLNAPSPFDDDEGGA